MAAPAPALAHQHSVAFNLGLIALTVAVLGLGLAYVLDRAAHADAKASPSQAELTRTLAGTELTIPATWFRYQAGPVDGLVKEVDLRLYLQVGDMAEPAAVDITLVPRSRVRPSSKLLDGVYLHQFEDQQLSGPVGLVGKPLKAEDGFAGEVVWYDALSPDPFVAKCSRATASAPAQCLRTVNLGPGLAAVYAFGEPVLDNWRQLDAALAAPLKQIGAL